MSGETSAGPGGPGPCRYAGSRLLFRGPERALDGRHVAVIGGSESFAKGRPVAWPERLEAELGVPCANLAQPCGSVEAALRDAGAMAAVEGAAATVVVLTGAANLSNRLYGVHPRRNDRVVRVAPALRVLFPEVDFAEVCFTRHLLRVLEAAAPDRFDVVRDELRIAWAARMRTLLDRVPGAAMVLWLAEGPPPEGDPEGDALGPDPVFVTRAMVEALRPRVAAVVEAWGEEREARAVAGLAGPLHAALRRSPERAAV